MTPEALRAELARLRLTQVQAAKLLRVGERTMRRWCEDQGASIPFSVELLLPKLTKSEAKKLLKDSSLNLPEVEG